MIQLRGSTVSWAARPNARPGRLRATRPTSRVTSSTCRVSTCRVALNPTTNLAWPRAACTSAGLGNAGAFSRSRVIAEEDTGEEASWPAPQNRRA